MSDEVTMRSFPLGMATREAYGRKLVTLGGEDQRIVVLDADLSKSTQTRFFAEAFPERFFNVGIAEQNLVGTAAGLALAGKIPFVSTFAVFCPGRCFDQLRMSVAYSRTNVKVASSHAGLTVGEDGASHQSIEDLALMRSLPGFTILVPADEVATAWAVRTAVEIAGPVYIRLGRAKAPIVYSGETAFKVGGAMMLQHGTDVTLIACGSTVSIALQAADLCASEGISARVLDLYCLEPLDREAVALAARQTGALVTAEEHLLAGGMGSAVAMAVARSHPVPIEFVGIDNTYGQSGTPAELLALFNLTPQGLLAAAKRAIARKGGAAAR